MRGTPAGMITTSQSFNAAPNSASPAKPFTCAAVLMCETSAATPGVPAISYRESSVTRGFCVYVTQTTKAKEDGRDADHEKARG